MNEHVANERRKLGLAEFLTLALILSAGASLRLTHLGVGYLSMHSARDCYRALWMIRGEIFPAAGAEMLYGGRTVGWFYYLLLSFPLAVSPSTLLLTAWIGALSTVSLLLCHLTCRRLFGVSTGLAVTALFAASPISIAMMRYLWNPAFLPIFNVMALMFLMLWAVDDKRWSVGAFLVVWGLAFQIHFSAYIYGVAFLALMPWRRCLHPNWRPVLIAMLSLAPFFWPYFAREIDTQWSNAEGLVDDIVPVERIFTLTPNRTFAEQALQHLHVDLHEPTAPQRYTHFVQFMESLGGHHSLQNFALAVELITWVQVPLFVAGIVALLTVLLDRPRGTASQLQGLFRNPERARRVASVLLTWIGVSSLLLLMLREHAPGLPRPIPARYFIIWYPIQYIVMIFGLRAMLALRGARRDDSASRSGVPMGAFATALVTILALAQGTLTFTFLRVSDEMGVTFCYSGHLDRPLYNHGDKWRIAQILVEERGLSERAFLEQFLTADRRYSWLPIDEEFIDYELFGQRRFTIQADPPSDVFYYLVGDYDRFALPEDRIEILHTDRAGALQVHTLRVTDPDLIIPRQYVMNPYVW